MKPIRSERVSFTGHQGYRLDAVLDFPQDIPRAYALLAHCFTCSKDYIAATRISRGLAEHGIAVFRFDFTGLGSSEGDFANTNFSSNVGDLKLAADFLRKDFEAPKILVGHSLGGSAVLAVAGQIPETVAVATIAAPSDPVHLREQLAAVVPEIETYGEVAIEIAGRPFRIQKQFLEDISSHNMQEAVRQLDASLLIFHSPMDTVVGIENSRRIFQSAKHPKSFISLDKADHLLTHREDAKLVADVLAAWVSRLVPRREADQQVVQRSGLPGEVVVAERGEGRYVQTISMGRHTIISDEPEDVGGNDLGGTPYDLLLASLGACSSMTMRMYAEHKKLPVDHIEITLRHEKISAEHCQGCKSRNGWVDRIERIIKIRGKLSQEQRKRMLRIADKCPVHRSLCGEVQIISSLGE